MGGGMGGGMRGAGGGGGGVRQCYGFVISDANKTPSEISKLNNL